MPSYECAPEAARRPLPTTYARREPEKSVLHELLSDYLETFLEELAREGRYLPQYVVQELRRFLPCGLLSEGFARVQCRDCGDELLVAFSCKGRAFCPSCCVRRMSDTAAHLVDRVLPETPYRHWVLSYPYPVRLALARDARAAALSCTILVSEIFRLHRRRGKRAGQRGAKPGAISFTQRFGAKLNAHLHHHLVVPDAVFVQADDGGACRLDLAPPTRDELARLLERVVRRTLEMLRSRGLLDEEVDLDDALSLLQAQALQASWGGAARARPLRRFAVEQDGFSLEAGTHLHPHDRAGLEHLCRYGLRPPFAQHRLTWLGDGRIQLELRRPAPDGVQAVAFTPRQLLSRLAALVPPPRAHLTRYHGVFAGRSKLRRALRPPPKPDDQPDQLRPPPPELRERRLPWADLLRRVFDQDVMTCSKCGGPRRVIAIVADPQQARDTLAALGLHVAPLRVAKARGPPLQLDLPPPDSLAPSTLPLPE